MCNVHICAYSSQNCLTLMEMECYTENQKASLALISGLSEGQAEDDSAWPSFVYTAGFAVDRQISKNKKRSESYG